MSRCTTHAIWDGGLGGRLDSPARPEAGMPREPIANLSLGLWSSSYGDSRAYFPRKRDVEPPASRSVWENKTTDCRATPAHTDQAVRQCACTSPHFPTMSYWPAPVDILHG